MRVPLSNRRHRLEMNMTPMIDVVFLLIIFFLVSSHLQKQEAHAELDLPTAETGDENTPTFHPVRIITKSLLEHVLYRPPTLCLNYKVN